MKLQSIAILFLLFQLFHLNGQIAEEINRIDSDSLLNILPELEGTKRIDVLNQIAFDLSRDKPDTAIAISLETLRISETSNYLKGVADAHLSLGLTYLFLDSLKISVSHYLNALLAYENVDTCLGMGLVYFTLMNINQTTGRYEMSKEYGKNTLKIYEAIQNPCYKAIVLLQLAFTYTMNAEYDSSDYYNEQGLAILDKYPNPHYEARFYVDMGYNLAAENYYADSLIHDQWQIIKLYKKTADVSERAGDSITYAMALDNLIFEYQQMKTEEGNKKWLETTQRLINFGDNKKIWPQTLASAYQSLGV